MMGKKKQEPKPHYYKHNYYICNNCIYNNQYGSH